MACEIRAKQTVVRGEKMWQILEFKGFEEYEQLPKEYEKGIPRISKYSDIEVDLSIPIGAAKRLNGQSISSCQGDYMRVDLFVGKMYTKQAFEEILFWAQTALTRLAAIEKRLEEENRDWHDEKVFTF